MVKLLPDQVDLLETLAQTCSAWKTFDTRDAPSSYSKQKYTSISEQPIQDIPIPDDVHVSNTEDTNATHLINIKPRQDWLKPIPEEERQKHNINQRFGSPFNMAEDDHRLGNLKNASYYNAYLEMAAKHDCKIATAEGGKKKSTSKTDQSKKPATAKQPKPVSSKSLQLVDEPGEEQAQPEPQREQVDYDLQCGKGKSIATDEQVAQSLLELQTPKKTICDTMSPTDAETCAETDKMNSKGDTEILNIGKEQGEDVADKVYLEEKIAEIDEGQAGSDLDLPHKIDQIVNEAVKEAVQVALQAPFRERFQDLSKADMKEILCDRMFESDPPSPPSKELDQRKKKKHDSDASGSIQTLAQTCSAWKTFDTRDAPSSYSKQKYTSISEQPIQYIPIPDDVHVSNTEDTNAAHLINIKPRQDWLKPIPEEERQ
nr:hypothetical protein [Tanacetum cinerariifolium]